MLFGYLENAHKLIVCTANNVLIDAQLRRHKVQFDFKWNFNEINVLEMRVLINAFIEFIDFQGAVFRTYESSGALTNGQFTQVSIALILIAPDCLTTKENKKEIFASLNRKNISALDQTITYRWNFNHFQTVDIIGRWSHATGNSSPDRYIACHRIYVIEIFIRRALAIPPIRIHATKGMHRS